MKKVFVLLLAGFLANALNAQYHKRVLFLGNSYTYGNDMPKLIKDMAQSTGDTLSHDQNTPGGYRMMQHASDAASLGKASNGIQPSNT